eukprot:CAMPEP_0172914452 /NCGR_PEP_ID=MMETSP1075-20121228/192455_1 /TAXON_ID=2916 /ORGANISM="Ceratium fusus, Strain PA161109" /LENGTH=65 /DNA_ID=CAMNT_0013773375 /DNA_START=38 /DNA_END=235 /DNA_ORIENTATION=+
MTEFFDNSTTPGEITTVFDEKVVITEGPFPHPCNSRIPRVRVRVLSHGQTGWINGCELGLPLLPG